MQAAVITAPGTSPVYTDFPEPTPRPGEELIHVTAAALSPFTRSRASGAHYSADSVFPAVPGSDGVGRTADGRRLYFVLPRAPFGAMAPLSVARPEQCVPIPDTLDDITAAAIANPGMSAWTALAERARLQPGKTVLINGATGAAGRLAVQLAKHLGAGKVIAAARNPTQLQQLTTLGADSTLPFDLAAPTGADDFEAALEPHIAAGIHVVVDYLWGSSANTIITAIARHAQGTDPIRFVQVGTAGGEETIQLPGAALRSSPILLMGSGVKSVPLATLLDSIASTFAAYAPARLQIDTRPIPLAEIAGHWENSPGLPRLVFTL